MYDLMSTNIAPLSKPFTTEIARVGLLASMSTLVRLKENIANQKKRSLMWIRVEISRIQHMGR